MGHHTYFAFAWMLETRMMNPGPHTYVAWQGHLLSCCFPGSIFFLTTPIGSILLQGLYGTPTSLKHRHVCDAISEHLIPVEPPDD